MENKHWKDAIVKALRDKGFTKKAARKTAVKTMLRSVECRKKKKVELPPTEKKAILGALHQSNTMTGKIVVVHPSNLST